MPPKRAPTAGNRTQSPPGPPPAVEDEDPEPSNLEDEPESATPVTTADFRRLLNRLEELEAQQYPHNFPKDPQVPPPPEFTGKVSEYRNFIAQCALVFTLCPRTYGR